MNRSSLGSQREIDCTQGIRFTGEREREREREKLLALQRYTNRGGKGRS
jgi:hypothetical protein